MLPNLRRLSLTLVVLAIIVAGVHGVHVARQGRSIDLLKQAVENERKGDNPVRLIAALKRYLLVQPKDKALRKELIDLQARYARTEDEVLEVYYELQEQLKQHPEDPENRERLISFALQLREYQDVLTHVSYLETLIGKTPQLLMWKALAQEKTADLEGAIKSYRETLELDPAQIDAYVQMANILRQGLNAPDEAKYWILRLTELNPKSAAAFLAQAQYYLDIADLASAFQSVDAALQFPENRTEGVLLWSEVVMMTGEREARGTDRTWQERDEEIAERLRKAWEEDPEEPRFAAKLSAFALRKKQPDEAVRILQLGLERVPGDPLLLWELADLEISRGEFKEAQRKISDLTAANVNRGLVDYLRGRILIHEKRWSEAAASLQRSLGDLESSPRLTSQANIFLAECYAELGDSDQRLTVCRRAVETMPFFVAARQHLAQALLAVGRVDEALAEYRTMIDLPDAPAFGWTADVGWAAVAKVLIIRNLSAPKGEANWDDLEPALNALTAAAPDSIDAVLLRAEVLASQSKVAEAREQLLKYPIDTKQDVRWWVALIHLSLRDGDLDGAEQRLRDAMQAIGSHVELKSLEIKLAVFQGERGRERLAEFAGETAGLSDTDRARLLYELAGYYVSLGSMEDAQTLWRDIAALTPQDLRVWLLQFDAAINRKDFDGCRGVIESMQKIEGKNGSYTQLAESFLIIRSAMLGGDTTRLESARGTLTALQARRPRWARVPWALGMLDELDGRREHAVEHYRTAFKLGDRSPELVRRTLDLLQDLRRYDQAEELIHSWEKLPNSPILPEINRMAAEVLLEQQEPVQALLRAHRAVSKNSSDYQDHLWLARIHQAGGALKEAEEELRTAIRLAPLAGECWVALIHQLQSQKRPKEAEALIERIRAEVTIEGQSAVLAVCYEALGKFPEAEAEFLRAVDEAPQNRPLLLETAEFFHRQNRLKEAERHWRRLLDACLTGSVPERCTARRGLASALAYRGDYPAFREAVSLVEQNLKELPRSMLDLRAKATLFAVRGDPRQRRESVELFTKLAREAPPLTERDQSLLATMYELNGDLTRAYEAWQALVAVQSSNREYLARYISVLLKRHAMSDAKVWLERLQSVAPDWQPTLELQAEFSLQGERQADVAALFQNFIQQAEGEDARARRQVEAGEATERLANTLLRQKDDSRNALLKFSEQCFRDYASSSPGKTQVLAGFLLRTGRADEALDLFDESWNEAPPDLVSSVLTASLLQSHPTPEMLTRAVAAISRHQTTASPASLLNDLAALSEGQQNFDLAETHYRKALEREPDNIAALNNLAFLLALQNRNLSEAGQLLDKALNIAGPLPALLDTRAQIALSAGDLDAAQEDREFVANASPTPASWFRLAIVYHQQKQDRKMREAALKAKEGGLQPKDLHFLERRHLEVILKSVEKKA